MPYPTFWSAPYIMNKRYVTMEYEKLGDHELVHHYTNGNEWAFNVLAKRHRKEIYQRIYLIVRDKMMAEDILQDTFIRMVRSIRAGTYNEEGRFLPWAIAVAKNLCLDHKRKTKGSRVVSYDLIVSELSSTKSAPMKCRISEGQLQQQMEYILNQLPDVQRTVIKYRHYEEMSFKEISSVMGTNVNTTMGRMRYGLKNLNRMICNNRSAFSDV
jgi:RNA polymerase sigma factor (sigma-70 family)